MHSTIFFFILSALSVTLANPIDGLEPRASLNGACTGSGGAPGVCIATSSCTKGGGTYINNACPGTPSDIKCCTKTSCGSGGNCRFASQCSTGNIVANLCPGPTDFKCCQPKGAKSPFDGPITRSEIMSRAQFWMKEKVAYDMGKTYPDPNGVAYRTDCSGFVAMALRTTPPGRNTEAMIDIAKEIKWEDLQPGDFAGTLGEGTGGSNGHVTLFQSWVDAKTKQKYNSLECMGTKQGCRANVRDVKWTHKGRVTKPYRYIRVK